MNIKDLLFISTKELKNIGIEDANLKCKILLANILNVSREYLVIHDQDELNYNTIYKFQKKLEELEEGVPIQYITNNQEFMGLDFYVNESVLIPQPDTEILVEYIIENPKKDILDICTGSGAIAVSIAKNIETANVIASDISKKALEVATKNANTHDVKVEFILSDMFQNITGKFDIIVSNPPYIEENIMNTLPKEVQNEPYIALAGGNDGLKFYRIIAKEGKNFLNKDGYIAVEIGYNQKESVMEIFRKEGYKDIFSKKDFSNNDRIVVAKI